MVVLRLRLFIFFSCGGVFIKMQSTVSGRIYVEFRERKSWSRKLTNSFYSEESFIMQLLFRGWIPQQCRGLTFEFYITPLGTFANWPKTISPLFYICRFGKS